MPTCSANIDDIDYNLIEYYLENKIILPIINDYESYPSKYIDLILQYPHTSLSAIKTNIFNNNLSLMNCICPNCLHGDGYNFIEDYIKNKEKNFNRLDDVDKSELETIKGCWYYIGIIENNKHYTNELFNIINIKSSNKRELSLTKLYQEVYYTYNYITSKSLKANYVLNFDNVTQFKSYACPNNEVSLEYQEFCKLILQGLHLYSPKDISDFNYINLLLDNRKKIQNIVKLVPENYLIDQNYIKIRSIFDNVNEEVRTLSSSKRMEILKFSTNFISSNYNLLKSGILNLCGIKNENIEMPNFENGIEKKTIDYLSEKILPFYLQKPLPLIQLWKLQKEIKKQ